MQRFCFSSSGILLITADSSAPANQNYRNLQIKTAMPWKESLIFPLKFHKPGLHLLQFLNIIFQAPTQHPTELLTKWIFKPKVPKSSPKHGQVVTGIPHLLVPICLSQGFYSCTNIMTKKQVGEERVYSAYTSILLFITKGSQDWNSSRSESRSWCRGHGGMFFTGLLPLACSACSLIEPKTTSPEMVPPTRGLSPWSLIEKMPYSWISWRHFLNWSSFLCDNSSCVKLTQN